MSDEIGQALEALQSDQAEERCAAVRSLLAAASESETPDPTPLAALQKSLDDADALVQGLAGQALLVHLWKGQPAEPLLNQLGWGLGDEAAQPLRQAACSAFVAAARQAVEPAAALLQLRPVLLEQLRSRSKPAVLAALAGLPIMLSQGLELLAAVPLLVDLVGRLDPELTKQVVSSLLGLVRGASLEPVVPELRARLDGGGWVAWMAAQLLLSHALGNKQQAEIIALCQHPQAAAREGAIARLAEAAQNAMLGFALPALAERLEEQAGGVLFAVLNTLRAVVDSGESVAPAVPGLLKTLERESFPTTGWTNALTEQQREQLAQQSPAVDAARILTRHYLLSGQLDALEQLLQHPAPAGADPQAWPPRRAVLETVKQLLQSGRHSEHAAALAQILGKQLQAD